MSSMSHSKNHHSSSKYAPFFKLFSMNDQGDSIIMNEGKSKTARHMGGVKRKSTK